MKPNWELPKEVIHCIVSWNTGEKEKYLNAMIDEYVKNKDWYMEGNLYK